MYYPGHNSFIFMFNLLLQLVMSYWCWKRRPCCSYLAKVRVGGGRNARQVSRETCCLCWRKKWALWVSLWWNVSPWDRNRLHIRYVVAGRTAALVTNGWHGRPKMGMVRLYPVLVFQGQVSPSIFRIMTTIVRLFTRFIIASCFHLAFITRSGERRFCKWWKPDMGRRNFLLLTITCYILGACLPQI